MDSSKVNPKNKKRFQPSPSVSQAKKQKVVQKPSPDYALQKRVLSLIEKHRLSGVSNPYRRAREDIPFLLPDFYRGTQLITTRLYMNSAGIVVSSGASYVAVVPLQLSAYNNSADLVGVFDEYRFIRGACYYTPSTFMDSTTWVATSGLVVGAIDYAIPTAFASFDAALSHDEKQIFYLVAIPAQKHNPKTGVAKWRVEPDWIPDQEWIPATSNAVPCAFLKFYAPSTNLPGSGTTGFISGWMDVQWRGTAA